MTLFATVSGFICAAVTLAVTLVVAVCGAVGLLTSHDKSHSAYFSFMCLALFISSVCFVVGWHFISLVTLLIH